MLFVDGVAVTRAAQVLGPSVNKLSMGYNESNNGEHFKGFLEPRPRSLIQRLVALECRESAVDELFLNILTRYPSAAERQWASAYLVRPDTLALEAFQDLAWALLTSNEFRFNH